MQESHETATNLDTITPLITTMANDGIPATNEANRNNRNCDISGVCGGLGHDLDDGFSRSPRG